MASYSLEDFVGSGVLRENLDKLAADGWGDVPTLKMMSSQDMEDLQLTQQQRDALEIRTYLHDRSLMEYADKLEVSGKNLPELLNTSPAVLASQYGMKRGHVARLIDRGRACGIQMPRTLALPGRKRTLASGDDQSGDGFSEHNDAGSKPGTQTSTPLSLDSKSVANAPRQTSGEGFGNSNRTRDDEPGFKPPVVLRPVGDPGGINKGVFSAAPPSARLCGLVQPNYGAEDVTPLSVLEKVFIQKLTPEHKKGVDPWMGGSFTMPPPSKASDLWATKPTLLLCLRRPGCVMCRAEAHQLYARKPIFDAMGVQMVVVLNEYIDAEVRAFWPRFWGGIVAVDENRDFFKALGGGHLLKESIITGFIFNPLARENWKRAKATGIDYNSNGEGAIKGGLYIIRPGKGGVAYQFVERNFGDWAPMEEVLQVCGNLRRD